ncbi:MAG: nitrous oxide reductase family maturation protein NosD, partial [Thermoplasmatota archaeon]
MKRTVFLIMLTLVIISWHPPVEAGSIDGEEAHTRSGSTATQMRILVGPYENYTTIQSAVDDANEGDIIEVLDGTYHAPITIDKPLTLMTRNGWSGVTVRALRQTDHGFIVTSDGVEIRGFYLTGWDRNWSSRAAEELASGVILKGVDNCTIEFNRIANFNIGVMLYYSGTYDRPVNSDNNTIRYNSIQGGSENHGYTGIAIEGYTGTMYGTPTKWSPMNNLIFRNRIHGTYIAVVSNGGLYNEIIENTFEENDIGIHLDGCHFNTISENEMIGSTKHAVALDATANNTANNFANNSTNQPDTSTQPDTTVQPD